MAEDCKPPCGPNTAQTLPVSGPPGGDGVDTAPACLPPMQFCQTTSTTGPVNHPGRLYDITLPINPGFQVDSLQVDQITSPANIVWNVSDPDGERFRQDLTTFMEGRLPPAATVTITNPNAGFGQVCGAALPMQIHIECLRLDQNPPNLVELLFDAGQDMILNPAYNESPALSPPVAEGDYGYHLLSRQDDPGPFPGNQPANDALCTSTTGRGWETNDIGRTFEIWGRNVATGVTPTPRGTPVQEITSDGPPPGGRSTIWQTFSPPVSGNFNIRIVHGARDAGENHRITLDNGDTDDAQNGTLINDITNDVPVVYNNGQWTTFSQSIPLNAGSTYTLALSTNNPAGGARGGLFTDMRAFISVPGTRATATIDDDTCVVTVEETSNDTTCEFWQPSCESGSITSWTRVTDGTIMTNAEFWAQVPTPGCCLPQAAGGEEGGVALGNMTFAHEACTLVNGVPTTVIRTVITDQNGGIISQQFVGPNGAPVQATNWTPGRCTSADMPVYGEDCGGGTIEATGPAIVQNVPHPQAVQRVAICRDDTAVPEEDSFLMCDPSNADAPVLVTATYGSSGVPTLAHYNLDGTPFTGDTSQLAVCGGAAPIPPEIDQYDTAPVSVCFTNAGNTEYWVTYERVLFNNVTQSEVSRTRHYYNVQTNVDQTAVPAGSRQDCHGVEVQVQETVLPGCVNGTDAYAVRRTAYFTLDGDFINATRTYIDNTGAETTTQPVGFSWGACADGTAARSFMVDLENQVTSTETPGCANGVDYVRRVDARYDSGGNIVDWTVNYVDGMGNHSEVMPTGFRLGLCVAPELNYFPVATGALGCADGVPYELKLVEIIDRTTGTIISTTAEYVDEDGVVTTVKPTNFELRPCASGTVNVQNFTVMSSELGCSDGTPYTMQTIQRVTPLGAPDGAPTVRWLDSTGAVVTVMPFRFRLGPCMQEYYSVLEELTGVVANYGPEGTIDVIPQPNGVVNSDFVSISIRHTSGTVTVKSQSFNAVGNIVYPSAPITLQTGETINLDAGDDPYGVLQRITVDTTDGSARIVTQWRRYDTRFATGP